jgi:hypothetical protein
MSSIAVFLVLGGASALAASQLGKNSVGSKQIKKNAVTEAKIKKNAVTSAKIKDGAVTGAKVQLSSLGTVPSASSATSAGTAISAGLASNLAGYQRKGIVRLNPTGGATESAAREAAPETPLFSSGALAIYAKCFSFGTIVQAEVFIRTSVSGAIFQSEEDSASGNPYLNTGTAELEREIAYESASTNSANALSFEYTHYWAMAPDGTAIQGDLAIAVKNGTPGGGEGVFNGNNCLFAGDMAQLNG